MSVFAQLHAKKEFANRTIVCAACILPTDEQLGFSFAKRPCARCKRDVDVGVVVSEPRPARRK